MIDESVVNRFPSKRSGLRALRRLGVEFGCVVDVGVQSSTEELVEVFPDLTHYLFEPVPQYLPGIRKRYQGIKHELFHAAVSDRDGVGHLQLQSADGSGNITHSKLQPGEDSKTIEVPLVRLSTAIAQNAFPSPILLKIDVDGHELPIIRGLKGAEEHVGCVVVEAPLKALFDRMGALQALGFVPWDINDLCYYKGCLWQVDMIFLSPELASRPELRPMETGGKLDWNAWRVFSRNEKGG